MLTPQPPTPVAIPGLPWRLSGKESACNAGDPGSIPGLGRSPGVGNGNPLQYSCLENLYGRRSPAGYSSWGCKEWDSTERPILSLHFSPQSKGNTHPVTLGRWCGNASAPLPSRGLRFSLSVSLLVPATGTSVGPGSQRALWGVLSYPCHLPTSERCSLDSPDKPFVLALCLRICLWKNRHYRRKVSFSYVNLHVFETRLFPILLKSAVYIKTPCTFSLPWVVLFIHTHVSSPSIFPSLFFPFFFFLNSSLAHRLLRNNQAFSREDSQPPKSNNIF